MPAESKKMLVLAILDILRETTDEDHRLLQADIIERLKRDYHLSATRKSVRRNISDLQTAGYPLQYAGGWYYEHEFCKAELNLLMDCVMSSSVISASQRDALTAKLKALGGQWYSPAIHGQLLQPANPQFMYVLETLHDAIARGTQVKFHYADYDVDKQLHPRLDQEGKAKEYIINPYRITTANGRYYLICNVDKYVSLAHFRLDRIIDIRATRKTVKPLEKVRGAEKGIDLPEYLAAHPYMYSGDVKVSRIQADRCAINDILDWFGMDTVLEADGEDSVIAQVVADEASLGYWLRRYGEHARLLPDDAE